MSHFIPSVWSDYFVDFRYFRLSQLALVAWMIVLLGVSSCDEATVNSRSSKMEYSQKPPHLLITHPSVQKIVYLNQTTFKVEKRGDNISIVPLNKGIEELLKIYEYLGIGNELIKVLQKYSIIFSYEYIDEITFKNALKELQEVKSRWQKAKGFVNFVNALSYAYNNSIENSPITTELHVTETQNIQDEDSNFTFWVQYVCFISGFLGILLLLLKFKSTKFLNNLNPNKIDTVLNPEKKVKDVDILTSTNLVLQASMNKSNSEEVSQLKDVERQRIEAEKINVFLEQQRYAKLQSVNEEKKVDSLLPPVTETIKTVNIEIKSLTPMVEIAYFSLPMNERIFSNATRSTVPLIGATFYIFKISPDGKTATFDFWNNPDAVERAIDKAYSHIDAACEILNDRDLKATHIITEESGFAELQDNKWIVKTKAKIKYLL